MKCSFDSKVVVRRSCGFVLWAISSVLTADLFLSLAGDDWTKRVVLFLLAVALEGSKILSWRNGGGTRLLALSLIVLSGIGSLGAALQTVQSYRDSTKSHWQANSPTAIRNRSEVLEFDRQIAIGLDRLAGLPSDFVTAAANLEVELKSLRQERSKLLSKSDAPGTDGNVASGQESMFDRLANAIGLPTQTVMLILLVFLAVNLEVAALVLAGHSGEVGHYKGSVGRSPTKVPTPQDFLVAAKDGAPLPVLHGRDVTARRLGISYYQAKKLVAELKASGDIKAKGKRLVLCQK